MENNGKEIRVAKGIPNSIEIGVYFYIDEEGRPVFDEEEMQREFDEKVKNLKGE